MVLSEMATRYWVNFDPPPAMYLLDTIKNLFVIKKHYFVLRWQTKFFQAESENTTKDCTKNFKDNGLSIV